nr:MAG TPA: Z DNA-binding protein [Caudoviricetes sp.]
MENKYKRIIAIDADTKEELGNVYVAKDEELIMGTKKKLSSNQKDYLQKKDAMGEMAETLGGYVHVFYVKDELLYNKLNLNPADVSRFLYLATYISYNYKDKNMLVKKEKGQLKPMSQKDIMKIMKLNKSAFYNFIKEMKSKELITEKDSAFYINEKYISKGKIKDNKDSYIRLYIDTTRYLYEHCTSRQHKQLGYVLQLLPYVDFDTNHILINDEKAEIRDIMKLLGVSANNNKAISVFKKTLLNFTINYQGNDYYLFGAHTFEYGKEFRTYFVINPLVLFAGNNMKCMQDVCKQLIIKP